MILTVILIGSENEDIIKNIKKHKEVECLVLEDNNYKRIVDISRGKYVVFINSDDEISKDYLDIVLDKIKSNSFDICFINYKIDFSFDKRIKFETDYESLKNKIDSFGYIFNFIYKKEKLVELFSRSSSSKFNEEFGDIFKERDAITDFIYFHKNEGLRIINSFPLKNRKITDYYKNIVYISDCIRGNFNGLMSWVTNIGRCYGKRKDITILYKEAKEATIKRLQDLGLNTVIIDNKHNYVCDNLIVTSNNYYLSCCIYGLEKKVLIVHAALDDYKDRYLKYNGDFYNEYYAVSKYAYEKSKDYFDTDKMSYILNPYKLDKTKVKRALNLVSAQRTSDFIKRNDRIKKMARLLDSLDIPYTWNVFGDSEEGTNKSGLIYRHRISNVIDYEIEADYFVILSDSEACPYSVIEALSVNTKVIATSIPCMKELGVEDGKNGFLIPPEYFNLGNEDKLCEKLQEIYDKKDLKFKYNYDESNYKKYEDLFID